MPSVVVSSVDYTSRDAQAIFQSMISAIPTATPAWSDLNRSDLGVVLLSQVAGHLDVLHFYVDRAVAEGRPDNAVTRRGVAALLRLLNYELRSANPASVDLTFSLSQTLGFPVLIPKGTKVQTFASSSRPPVVFETDEDLTIPPLTLEGSVAATEGESEDEDLGVSDGTAFQSFPADAAPIIDGTFSLLVDEGAGDVAWDLVATFVDSAATDEDYRLERDEDDKLTVFLGDDLTGKIPPATSTLRAEFRVLRGDRGGPGVFGNVGANTVTIIQDTITANGLRITPAVTNPEQAVGGEDRQSLSEAKRLGPQSLLALERAVTAGDYKFFLEQFGGVAKAVAIQGVATDPTAALALDLLIAPTGGGDPSSALRQDILDLLALKKMVGTCLEVRDPTYVDVDVAGQIFVRSNYNVNTVRDAVQDALTEHLDLESPFVDFGLTLTLFDVFAALGVEGVGHVDLSKYTRRPVAVFAISNGDATVGSISVGEFAVDETWTVTFLSATTFSVQATVSGLHADGVVGTTYTSDDGEISFLVTVGGTPNQVGDRFNFRTSRFLGNIAFDAVEIPRLGDGSIKALTFTILPVSVGNVC